MGAWIEIKMRVGALFMKMSHPTMGAWIEIWFTSAFNGAVKVAPHDGCVD